MFISHAMLRDHGACFEQRTWFRQIFPGGIEVARHLCIQYAEVFDFAWAGHNLLHGSKLVEFSKGEYELFDAKNKAIWDVPGVGQAECASIDAIRVKYQVGVAELFAKCAVEGE